MPIHKKKLSRRQTSSSSSNSRRSESHFHATLKLRIATNLINSSSLPFFTQLLFLFVIRNVFQSIDFFVVVALFPFFNVLSIFCVEMSALDSLTLHLSLRFSQSGFVFTAIFEPFTLGGFVSGEMLLLDSDISRFKPIFQGEHRNFPRTVHSLHTHSTSFDQLIDFSPQPQAQRFMHFHRCRRFSFLSVFVYTTISAR